MRPHRLTLITKKNQALGELPDVDGFLVGGASLKPTFTERATVESSVRTVGWSISVGPREWGANGGSITPLLGVK